MNGLRGREVTHIDTNGVATGSSRLRVETDVVGEGDEVVEHRVDTQVADGNLLGQALRQGVTQLDGLDLEVVTLEDSERGGESLAAPVLGGRELGGSLVAGLLPG